MVRILDMGKNESKERIGREGVVAGNERDEGRVKGMGDEQEKISARN